MVEHQLVSDGIKCYPTSTATNNYNNWGPINDLQVILQLPNNRTILSAYQLSTEMSSPSNAVAALDVINNQLHVLKVKVLFLLYKVLMLDNIKKEYTILMFSTDLLQHLVSTFCN